MSPTIYEVNNKDDIDEDCMLVASPRFESSVPEIPASNFPPRETDLDYWFIREVEEANRFDFALQQTEIRHSIVSEDHQPKRKRDDNTNELPTNSNDPSRDDYEGGSGRNNRPRIEEQPLRVNEIQANFVKWVGSAILYWINSMNPKLN